MSKYSSDSDSSIRHRNNRRRRSHSSSSSDSSHHRRSKKSPRRRSSSRYKKSFKRYNRRSRRSRSRSNTASRKSRSLSRDKRRRSYSRDRYKSKRRHKSRSHSKGRNTRYCSRSSSNETCSRQSRSSVRSNSSSSNSSKKALPPVSSSTNTSEDQLREKLLKAIKAAESADHQLKQQGVLAKGVKSRNDLNSLTSVKPHGDVINAIEKDEFVPKSFSSSKSRKVNFDDSSLTPAADEGNSIPEDAVNSIFHASFFCDPKVKLERWVKKLYQIRQRAISGEPLVS